MLECKQDTSFESLVSGFLNLFKTKQRFQKLLQCLVARQFRESCSDLLPMRQKSRSDTPVPPVSLWSSEQLHIRCYYELNVNSKQLPLSSAFLMQLSQSSLLPQEKVTKFKFSLLQKKITSGICSILSCKFKMVQRVYVC